MYSNTIEVLIKENVPAVVTAEALADLAGSYYGYWGPTSVKAWKLIIQWMNDATGDICPVYDMIEIFDSVQKDNYDSMDILWDLEEETINPKSITEEILIEKLCESQYTSFIDITDDGEIIFTTF